MQSLSKYSIHILSIVIAFFLWMYVLSSAQTNVNIKAQIHYILPSDKAIINAAPKSVTFNIEGPKALVRAFEQTKKNLKVNVKEVFEQDSMEYEFSVKSLGLDLPFGVKIISIKPQRLEVKLEQAMTQEVPIELQTVGAVPIDHKLISTKLTPSTVKISGPKSLIEKMQSVKTSVYNLDALTQSKDFNLNLNKPDQRVSLSINSTQVGFDVETTRSNMIIKDMPIFFLTPSNIKSSSSKLANLVVLAENTTDFKLKTEEIRVIAEVVDSSKSKHRIKLRAKLPNDLYLLKILPEFIDIEIEN